MLPHEGLEHFFLLNACTRRRVHRLRGHGQVYSMMVSCGREPVPLGACGPSILPARSQRALET